MSGNIAPLQRIEGCAEMVAKAIEATILKLDKETYFIKTPGTLLDLALSQDRRSYQVTVSSVFPGSFKEFIKAYGADKISEILKTSIYTVCYEYRDSSKWNVFSQCISSTPAYIFLEGRSDNNVVSEIIKHYKRKLELEQAIYSEATRCIEATYERNY